MFRTELLLPIWFICAFRNVSVLSSEVSPDSYLDIQLIKNNPPNTKVQDDDLKIVLETIGKDLLEEMRKGFTKMQMKSDEKYSQLEKEIAEIKNQLNHVELAVGQIGRNRGVKKRRVSRSPEYDIYAIEKKWADYYADLRMDINRIGDQFKLSYINLEKNVSHNIQEIQTQLNGIESLIEKSNFNYVQLTEKVANGTEEFKSPLDVIKSEIIQFSERINGFDSRLSATAVNLSMQNEELELKVKSMESGVILKLDSIFNFLAPAADCKSLMSKSDDLKNGVYRIQPNNTEDTETIRVFCDVNDGGWTVIQRRGVRNIPKAKRESFNRNWTEYENGFGSPNDDHWIGLKHMHRLTQNCENELKVTLTTSNGTELYVTYSKFQVSGQEDDYRLTVGNFTGGSATLGNELERNNNMKFSTFDKNNNNGSNCFQDSKEAWWNECKNIPRVNLNGEYSEDGKNGKMDVFGTGIYWFPSIFGYESLKKTEMKIRSKC